LALGLASRIEDRIDAILNLKCSQREARSRLREIEPNVPEKDHPRFLKLLREARDNPISANNRSTWSHLLTEFAMVFDPADRFPELEEVRSVVNDGELWVRRCRNKARFVKGKEARLRSELSKFFNEALKNLLGT
jgi:hypothetical protein